MKELQEDVIFLCSSCSAQYGYAYRFSVQASTEYLFIKSYRFMMKKEHFINKK